MAHKRDKYAVKRTKEDPDSLQSLMRQVEDLRNEAMILDREKTSTDKFRYLYKAFSALAKLTRFYSQMSTTRDPNLINDVLREQLKEYYFPTVDSVLDHILEIFSLVKSEEGGIV